MAVRKEFDVFGRVRVVPDLASAQSAAAAIQNTVDKTVSKSTKNASRRLSALEKTVKGVTSAIIRAAAIAATFFGVAAVSRFFSNSIQQFAAFDKALTDSVSLLGKFGLAYKREFADVIKQVSKDLNFEFSQTAEAVQHLISAGFDATQTMRALPVVANFAKAGGIGLKESVDFLADSVMALGLATKDPIQLMTNMTRVSDVLAQANNIANATIEDFAAALTNKAAAAMKMFNIPLEEGVAVLAAFAAQGKKGQTAGELFDIFLREVTRTAVRSKEAFKTFGIEVFDAQGNTKNLADVVESLSIALTGLSDEQQVQALMQLGFTFRSIQSIKALVGMEDAIRAYEKELRDASGTTQEMTDVRMTSFAERWGQTKRVLQEARIEIGEALIPALDDVAERLVAKDGMIGALEKIGKWVSENQEAISGFLVTITDLVTGLINLSAALAKPFILTFNLVSNPDDAWDNFVMGVKSKWFFPRPPGGNLDNMSRGAQQIRSSWDRMMAAGGPKPILQVEAERLASGGTSGSPPSKPKPKPKILQVPPDPDLIRRQTQLMQDLNEEIARYTDTRADNELERLNQLELRFKAVYKDSLPNAAREGFAKLRKLAQEMQTIEGRERQLGLFGMMPATQEVKDSLDDFISQLMRERDALEEGSKAREKYNDLLREAGDLHEDITKDIVTEMDRQHEFIDALYNDIIERGEFIFDVLGADFTLTFDQMAMAGETAADTIFGSFETVFRMIRKEARDGQSLFEALAESWAGAILNGTMALAGSKVAQNIAQGFENLAMAKTMLAASAIWPGLAASAAVYKSAAMDSFVAAAKWAAVGGVAAGAAAALGGGGRGSAGRGASDVAGGFTENQKGPYITIYLDGVDPKNPRHQRLIYDTQKEFEARGGTMNVRTRSNR